MGGYRCPKLGLKLLVLYRLFNGALSSAEVIQQRLNLKQQGNLQKKMGVTGSNENHGKCQSLWPVFEPVTYRSQNSYLSTDLLDMKVVIMCPTFGPVANFQVCDRRNSYWKGKSDISECNLYKCHFVHFNFCMAISRNNQLQSINGAGTLDEVAACGINRYD
jgi:hypothetical protein